MPADDKECQTGGHSVNLISEAEQTLTGPGTRDTQLTLPLEKH